jgi:hypothetical protein
MVLSSRLPAWVAGQYAAEPERRSRHPRGAADPDGRPAERRNGGADVSAPLELVSPAPWVHFDGKEKVYGSIP